MTTTQVILVARGQTDWDRASRIQGNLDIPLNSEGQEIIMERSREMRRFKVVAVYSGKEQPCVETAKMVADTFECRSHSRPGLSELNQGHWQGLLEEEAKARHPKAYRQWLEAPTSVCPPDGETLATAYDRVERQLKKIVRKHNDECIAVVFSPLANMLARCCLKGIDVETIESVRRKPPEWELLEVTGA